MLRSRVRTSLAAKFFAIVRWDGDGEVRGDGEVGPSPPPPLSSPLLPSLLPLLAEVIW